MTIEDRGVDLHETHVCRDCGAEITIPYVRPGEKHGVLNVPVKTMLDQLKPEWDRLRAIEAAAREFMEYDDGPPDLPEDEWEPAARVLWDALSEVPSDDR
jgi:hypothetical protein